MDCKCLRKQLKPLLFRGGCTFEGATSCERVTIFRLILHHKKGTFSGGSYIQCRLFSIVYGIY